MNLTSGVGILSLELIGLFVNYMIAQK